MNRFKKYKKIAGLEIHIKPDQSYVYNLVVLERKENKIEILNTFIDVKSIEAITKIEGISTLPIAAVLNGKSIINKKITGANPSNNNPVATVIPNANPEEFAYEISQIESNTWISIARKEVLEKIIEAFSEVGLNIIDLSLGVFVIQEILALVDDQHSIETTGYNLEIVDKKIVGVSTKETLDQVVYEIGEDRIDARLLSAFSKAFSNLVGVIPSLNNTSIISEKEEAFIYTNLFQKLKWGGLIGVFGLLLVNFFIFSYLNTQNQKTGVRLSMHQSQLSQLNDLKTRYQEKQTFINQASALKPSKISWFADQIGVSVEEGIQLQQIEIAPAVNKKQRRIDQQDIFDHHKIILKGVSKKSIFLNRWIKDLQALDWIEKVHVLPYSEEGNGKGVFELGVELK